ncbi:hypothetical protein [Mycobacterium sp.]|uniref:hypothetical protein n=1 Tax=Mycobacterium sp. TaxID=1785 RepID=UPI003F9E2D11
METGGHLALTPNQGGPGTSFEATATGFGLCGSVSFQWDGVELKSVDVETDGPVVATLQVPAGADARTHDVVASCGHEHAQSTFAVVVPETRPTLTLAPEKGDPETHITATITDFWACSDGNNIRAAWVPAISLQWDGTPLTPSNPSTVNGDKDVKLEFPVPAGASAGEHRVTVPCGNARLLATFTVTAPENPALALTPAQGGPGKQATATPTGFGACRAMSFQWDGQPLPTSPVGSDSLVVNFAVPKDASAGDHKVTATCGNTSAPATFTVVPAPKPTLTLDTGHGLGGSHLTASGTGFACGDGNVQLLWDGDIRLADASSGMFSAVPLTIPSPASTGGHMVVASCEHHPDIADSQRFTVTSVTTSVTTGPAALTLEPTSGHPGDQLRATGDGFACANHSGPVNLSWDDGTLLPGASLDPSGHFEAWVSVPAKTDARRLTLRATCSDGVVLAADFTVLASPAPPPPPPPPPPPKIPWLLIVLIVAGAILSAVEYARRRRHKRPETPPHVQAVPRLDGSPVVTLRETPERGEATHALRLEAHSGLSTLTVREVDG